MTCLFFISPRGADGAYLIPRIFAFHGRGGDRIKTNRTICFFFSKLSPRLIALGESLLKNPVYPFDGTDNR